MSKSGPSVSWLCRMRPSHASNAHPLTFGVPTTTSHGAFSHHASSPHLPQSSSSPSENTESGQSLYFLRHRPRVHGKGPGGSRTCVWSPAPKTSHVTSRREKDQYQIDNIVIPPPKIDTIPLLTICPAYKSPDFKSRVGTACFQFFFDHPLRN